MTLNSGDDPEVSGTFQPDSAGALADVLTALVCHVEVLYHNSGKQS